MGLIKIGSLWKKTNEKGHFLSGIINQDTVLDKNSRIMIFPNRFKNHPKSPDFNIHLLEPGERDEYKQRKSAFDDEEKEQEQTEESGEDMSNEEVPF